MKRIPISDQMFNESIGGITRRAIAVELLSNRTVFKTPIQAWFSKAQNVALVVLLLAICTVSAITVSSWVTYDKARANTIKEIYHSTATETAKNKRLAMEEVK